MLILTLSFFYHKIITFYDLIYLHNSIFVHQLQRGKLPAIFNDYFAPINEKIIITQDLLQDHPIRSQK